MTLNGMWGWRIHVNRQVTTSRSRPSAFVSCTLILGMFLVSVLPVPVASNLVMGVWGGLLSSESMSMGKLTLPDRSQSRVGLCGLAVVQSSRIVPVHSCSGNIMGGAGPSIVFCLACLAASCTGLARKWCGSFGLAAISARTQATSWCIMAAGSANCWTSLAGMAMVGTENGMRESEQGRDCSCRCWSGCFVDYNDFAKNTSLYSCCLCLATS